MENIMVIIGIVMVLAVGGWIVYEIDNKVDNNAKHQANAEQYHQLREDITMGRIGKKQVPNLQLYKLRKELSSERSRNLQKNKR